jgi:spermidine/putrescine transport system permease protein
VKKHNILLKIITGLVYFFLWAPVLVVVVFSFNDSKFGVVWKKFTFKWYYSLLDNAALQDSLTRSLIISVTVVTFSCIIGTLGAYGFYKLKFRFKKLLRIGMLLPIVLPGVVMGGSLLVYFQRVTHVPLGYITIILAQLSWAAPLALFIILGRMQRIDFSWEEAAQDLGASKVRTFLRITLPLLLPAIGAAALVVFPWSFDDFVITYFVSGVGNATLPIYIYSQLRFGASPTINCIGTILMTISISLLLLNMALENKNKRF